MAINTANTPESVRRRQRYAEQLLAAGSQPQKIESWTQGAAQLANALVGGLGVRKAERQAEEGKAAGNALLARLLGGGASASPEMAATTAPTIIAQAPTSQPGQMTPQDNPQAIQDRIRRGWQNFETAPQPGQIIPGQPPGPPPMQPQERDNTLGNDLMMRARVEGFENPQVAGQPIADPRQPLIAGLQERGLPAHVASGFVRNFQDESGLDPSINERQPVVPGSRGGFGLAQWTGPRRVALENFAAQSGRDVSDPNVQMDFLITELQGPEAKAAEAIMAAPDEATASQAIVQNFLRPAPENLNRRMAEYAAPGNAPVQMASADDMAALPAATPAQFQTPGAPRQPAIPEALTQLLSDPAAEWIDPEVRSMLINRALERRKPIEVGGRLVDPETYEVLADFSEKKAPTTQVVEGADGSKSALEYVNGQWRPIQTPGSAATAGAPKSPKLTEQQSKDIGFYNRGAGAFPLVDKYEAALTDLGDQAASSVPGVGNYLTSENYKLGANAGKEFLQAILRKDTGAAITAEETNEYGSVYLPRPGDTRPVLDQKRAARERALEGIRSGLGPAQILAAERPKARDAGALPADVTEDDISFTMQKHGLSREEVIKRLSQ